MVTRISNFNHDARRLLGVDNKRQHKLFHLKRAEEMRAKAHAWKETMEATAETLFGFVNEETQEHIDRDYMNLMSEAIEEENSRCLNRH